MARERAGRTPASKIPAAAGFAPPSRRRAGVTLIEVLIAVSLLSLLSTGMLMALRTGLSGMDKANRKLMDNRRITGGQRILEQQLAGFLPALAYCGPGSPLEQRSSFFQGEAQSLRLVSTYSIEEAHRGAPRILEFQVIPRPGGRGVRLVVNEHLYGGPRTTGLFCAPGTPGPQYLPIQTGPRSFVLADRLAYCRFWYQEIPPPPQLDRWLERWALPLWPRAVRVELRPLEANAAELPSVSVTAPLRVNRLPYVDYSSQ